MSWQDIIKQEEGYTEDELRELSPNNWEEFLMEIFEQDPQAEKAVEGMKKTVNARSQFGGYNREENVHILKKDWHKYVDDPKWIASLSWTPDDNERYSRPFYERSYESVDRSPPEY